MKTSEQARVDLHKKSDDIIDKLYKMKDSKEKWELVREFIDLILPSEQARVEGLTYDIIRDDKNTPPTFTYSLNVVYKDEAVFMAKIEEFLEMNK
jgi:hypothetical protein